MANFNLNKVILGGRMTADPELKQTPTGNAVITFSIAVNRKGKDPQTDFINCVAWRNTATFISNYFKKGSSICVTGSIQVRSWNDQQNQKRYVTEIIVEEAYFVDSKADDVANVSSYGDAPSFATQQEQKFEEIANDDELPF
ncbi:MAG: single-stranded DNA-binding protein [Clostridia bacterium]|nr:single-stranded DNA-binding protein [Clostridia bacterium]